MENRLIQDGELFQQRSQLALDRIPVFLSALQQANSSNTHEYTMLCTGAIWHYPSFATLQHCIELRDDIRPEAFRIFVVDQETERDYCERNGILVGPPAVFVWAGEKPLRFERKKGHESGYVLGPLNQRQIQSMLQSIREQTEDGSNKVVLKF